MKTRISPSGHRGQDGVALILVLLVGLMLLAMGALAEQLFRSSSTGATRHVQNEQALHLAEQGIDQMIATLQRNLAYTTVGQTDVNLPSPDASVSTPAKEQQWLLAHFGPTASTSGYGSGWLQKSPQGEFVSVQPAGRKTIYSIGWLPSRAAPKHVSVLKAEWLPAQYQPTNAIQTEGSLTLQGASSIDGIAGSVHANGDITTIGNKVTVSKTVSTSGSFLGNQTPNALGGLQDHSPMQNLPPTTPEDYWRDYGPTYGAGSWLDLCPPAFAGGPATVAWGPPNGATSPCTGTVQHTFSGNNDVYQGWSYSKNDNTWDYSGAGNIPGVFYAHHSSIRMTGSPGTASSAWKVLLLASASPDSLTCTGKADGNIYIGGSPTITSYNPHSLTAFAGADLQLNGTPSAVMDGAYLAVDQFDAGGNASLDGALTSFDVCKGTGKVAESAASGSMKITYDKDISFALGSTIRTTLWQELSATGFVAPAV